MWTHIAFAACKAQLTPEEWFFRPLHYVCLGIPRGSDGLWSPCRLERHYPHPCEPRIPEWAGTVPEAGA